MDIFGAFLDGLSNLFKGFLGVLSDLAAVILYLLPDSPFTALSNSPVAPYLGWINWFVPIQFILNTLVAWLSAIAVYYAYSIILRWIKAIG